MKKCPWLSKNNVGGWERDGEKERGVKINIMGIGSGKISQGIFLEKSGKFVLSIMYWESIYFSGYTILFIGTISPTPFL